MSKMFVKQDGNLFDILSKDRAFISKLKKVDVGYKNEKGSVSKCWEWQGACFQNGYGRLGTPVETKSELIHRTHRYAFYLANGKIKKSLSILHKCDNRICCNPKHLYQGDHRQNMKDMTDRGKQACGSRSGKAVFDETDVAFIRFFYSKGFTYNSLAVIFGSTKSTISNIVTRLQWNQVADIAPSEKRILRYIKSRKKQGRALVSVTVGNKGTSSTVKQTTVAWLRGNTDMFGQEKFAQIIKSSRKKIRVILENPDSMILSVDFSNGSMEVFTESKGNISPQRIIELIKA